MNDTIKAVTACGDDIFASCKFCGFEQTWDDAWDMIFSSADETVKTISDYNPNCTGICEL